MERWDAAPAVERARGAERLLATGVFAYVHEHGVVLVVEWCAAGKLFREQPLEKGTVLFLRCPSSLG